LSRTRFKFLTSSLQWGPDWSPLSRKHAIWRVTERAPSEHNVKVGFLFCMKITGLRPLILPTRD